MENNNNITDIQQELDTVRDKQWMKDMQEIYNKVEKLILDEADTSLEMFFMTYFELKKKLENK